MLAGLSFDSGVQRRGWDSNPRGACTPNGFQDRPVRPLRHPAGAHCDRRLGPDLGGRAVLQEHLGDAALQVLEEGEQGTVRDHRPVERVGVLEAALAAEAPRSPAATFITR